MQFKDIRDVKFVNVLFQNVKDGAEVVNHLINLNYLLRQKMLSTELINKPTEIIERPGTGYDEMDKLDLTDEDLFINFEETHKKYKLIVKEVCENYPLATNNDFILFIEVLRCLDLCQVTSGKDNFVFKIKREDIRRIPASETIRRSRQALNSQGLCLATDPRVLEIRKRKEKAVRDYFANQKLKGVFLK
jgi:hypothetical protein